MGGTFIITLREAFEAALLLGIVYTYLDKVGGRRYYRYVTLGGALGLLASISAGVGVSFLSGPLLDLGPDLVAAVVIFAAVALLTWHGWWMRQHARALKGELQQRVEEAQSAGRLWALGTIAFAGVFREGAETVLFLWGLLAQATSAASWSTLAAGVAGVVSAAALGWAIFRGGKQISLQRFFTVTSVLILLLAAGLFSAGIGKLEGLGFLPQPSTLWDSSFLLSDSSVAGGFLGGLVGYRARPSALEVGAYVAYTLAASVFLFGDVFRRARRAPEAASVDRRVA
ncbi:MAG: iron permease [Candidatus Rokuibacteriota bacterium]|nr:MAG: iron permease [Candidatus Rokubacteria bacterium]